MTEPALLHRALLPQRSTPPSPARFEHEGRPAVTLDRTAFYPTSGGQPFDTGRLGGVRTSSRRSTTATTSSTSWRRRLPQGAPVTGEIDWTRRFDHMQQHTGQHMLSGAFDRLFDNLTVSFHMGAEVSTIDLAREASPADIERGVDEANRIVWEDRPVVDPLRVAGGGGEPAAPEGTRSAKGTLRLIDISRLRSVAPAAARTSIEPARSG